MPIDVDCLADWLNDQVEELPTGATFRGQTINVRIGEAPQSRTFIMAGIQRSQPIEALMKREDAEPAPQMGEALTINGDGYKISTVTALLSLTEPPGYRLTLSLIM